MSSHFIGPHLGTGLDAVLSTGPLYQSQGVRICSWSPGDQLTLSAIGRRVLGVLPSDVTMYLRAPEHASVYCIGSTRRSETMLWITEAVSSDVSCRVVPVVPGKITATVEDFFTFAEQLASLIGDREWVIDAKTLHEATQYHTMLAHARQTHRSIGRVGVAVDLMAVASTQIIEMRQASLAFIRRSHRYPAEALTSAVFHAISHDIPVIVESRNVIDAMRLITEIMSGEGH